MDEHRRDRLRGVPEPLEEGRLTSVLEEFGGSPAIPRRRKAPRPGVARQDAGSETSC